MRLGLRDSPIVRTVEQLPGFDGIRLKDQNVVELGPQLAALAAWNDPGLSDARLPPRGRIIDLPPYSPQLNP